MKKLINFEEKKIINFEKIINLKKVINFEKIKKLINFEGNLNFIVFYKKNRQF